MTNSNQPVTRAAMKNGAVVIYERPGDKTSNLYYRIKVPKKGKGEGKTRYERKSTKTGSLQKAKEFALERYSEMLYAHKHGYTVVSPLIRTLLEDYKASLQEQYHEFHKISIEILNDKNRRIDNYLMEFFGDKPSDAISLADTEKYHTWKREEVERALEAEPQISRNYRVFNYETGQYDYDQTRLFNNNIWQFRKPTRASTQRDIGILLEAYDLAIQYRKVHRDDKPQVNMQTIKRTRRGCFDDDALLKISDYLSARYDHSYGAKAEEAIKCEIDYKNGTRSNREPVARTITDRVNFSRAQLDVWFHLMLAFGLRTNEMASLKWSQVKETKVKTKTGEMTKVQLSIIPAPFSQGIKMRRREITAITPDASVWIEELRKLRTAYFVERRKTTNEDGNGIGEGKL